MPPAPARLQTLSIFAAYAAAGVYWGAHVATLPAFLSSAP